MIPIRLFDSAATEFTTNGLGALPDAISCSVVEERNDSFELTMEYPVNGQHFGDISLRSIIVAKSNPYSNPQAFRVVEISKPINGIVTFYAQHISYDMSGIPVAPFTASGVANTFVKMKAAAVVDCPFSFDTNKTVETDFELETPMSMRSLLGGTSGSILDVFGTGEYEFDNYDVYLWLARGSDRGVTIRYGKNLTDIEDEEDCSSTYTHVYPYFYGAVTSDDDDDDDEDDNIEYTLVTLSEPIAIDGDFDYERVLVLDLTEKFDEVPTEDELQEEAEDYISDNDLGDISTTITVSFIKLTDSEEYKEFAALETIKLCDTVTVEYPLLGISRTIECIKTTYDVLTDRYEEIELGDPSGSLASTIASSIASISSLNRQYTDDFAYYKTLYADSFSAVYAEITYLTAAKASITDLDAVYATIENLSAVYATIEELEAETASITNLFADYALISTIEADYISVSELLEAYEISAEILEAKQAAITILTADHATITELEVTVADIQEAYIDYATINTLIANYISVEDLSAETAYINALIAQVAEINEAYISTATVGTLLAEYVKADDLVATTASIDVLESGYATITFGNIQVATIDTAFVNDLLVSGGILSTDITSSTATVTGYLTGVGIYADYIVAGTLDCANLTVANLTVGDLTVSSLNGIILATGETSSDYDNLEDYLNDLVDLINSTNSEAIKALEEAGYSSTEIENTLSLNVIVSSTIYYYLSSSSTELVDGEWSTTVPTRISGNYLWTRTLLTYASGASVYTDAICITGNTGVGVSSITYYYMASASSSGVSSEDPSDFALVGSALVDSATISDWDTEVFSVSSDLPYLWAFVYILYSDGSSYISDPSIIASYSYESDYVSELETVTSIVNGKSTVYYSNSAPSSDLFDLQENDIWFDMDGDYAMYKWTGTAWEKCEFSTNALEDGCISAVKIASYAVTAEKLAANSVTANAIAASSITGTKIAASTINATYAIINGTITGNLIAANTIDGDRIIANSITGTEIAASTINATEKIIANSITTDLIAANAITATQINAAAVNTTALAANAVTAAKISANAVITSKINANAVTANKIAANAITANHISANAVTANAIEAGAVTATKIDVDDLSALSATIGGFTIGNTAIYSSSDNFATDTNNVYISSSGISLSTKFYVNKSGYFYANSGTVGSLTVSNTGWYSYNSSVSGTYAGFYKPSSISNSTTCIFAGATSAAGANSNFKVTYGGNLTATSANISGTLTSKSGNYKSTLDSGNLEFYYNSALMGSYGSTHDVDDNTIKGVHFGLTYNCDFMSFSRRINSSTTTYTSFMSYDATGDFTGYSNTWCVDVPIRVPNFIKQGKATFNNAVINTTYTKTITLGSPFEGTPRLFTSVHTSYPQYVHTSVANINASSFEIKLYREASAGNATTNVSWMAIYQPSDDD